ncbi:MAG: GIY-YIG nuclease family protein, partial [Gammaproteobacteria bacterium]|nr:GIY-YIG nuclease family protein [Gammaproteobacteria bacterium]
QSVKNLIKDKRTNTCQCKFCDANLNCSTSHYVYEAKCTVCKDTYVGASRRPLEARISEHESSVRLNNNRTTLGQHGARQRHQYHEDPDYVPVSGKRDYDKFFEHFDFKVLEKCKDTLDTFLREGLTLKSKKPALNVMARNGFTE